MGCTYDASVEGYLAVFLGAYALLFALALRHSAALAGGQRELSAQRRSCALLSLFAGMRALEFALQLFSESYNRHDYKDVGGLLIWGLGVALLLSVYSLLAYWWQRLLGVFTGHWDSHQAARVLLGTNALLYGVVLVALIVRAADLSTDHWTRASGVCNVAVGATMLWLAAILGRHAARMAQMRASWRLDADQTPVLRVITRFSALLRFSALCLVLIAGILLFDACYIFTTGEFPFLSGESYRCSDGSEYHLTNPVLVLYVYGLCETLPAFGLHALMVSLLHSDVSAAPRRAHSMSAASEDSISYGSSLSTEPLVSAPRLSS